MATANLVLWIYIALLVAGGLTGYVKAKSQASLYMSVGFAAALALCAIGIITGKFADLLLIFLMVFFTLRLAKSKKFMPAGMMLALTILALVLRNLHF